MSDDTDSDMTLNRNNVIAPVYDSGNRLRRLDLTILNRNLYMMQHKETKDPKHSDFHDNKFVVENSNGTDVRYGYSCSSGHNTCKQSNTTTSFNSNIAKKCERL